MKRFHRAFLLAAALLAASVASPAHAAGVLVQSFANMAAFQASPFYDFVVNQLRAQHEAQGLHLDGHTARSGWSGERLNVGYAIDVLHPLATG